MSVEICNLMLETIFDIYMDSGHHYIAFVAGYTVLLRYCKAPKEEVPNFA
jgi:hypothetical protein